MSEARDLARLFKALGDETRLRLTALLARQQPGNALCVGRLAAELDTTTSNVSQHLRVLKDLGLVHGERRGYHIHYFIDEQRLADYAELAQTLLGAQILPEVSPLPESKDVGPTDEAALSVVGNAPLGEDCSPQRDRRCHKDSADQPCQSRP